MYNITFLLQIISVYITGHLDSIFPEEYRKEILRYLYNHQVHLLNFNILNLHIISIILMKFEKKNTRIEKEY